MEEYHQYIYDLERKKVIGDFDGAYSKCSDVWPTQHNMLAPHFSYIRGLLLKIHKDRKSDLTVLDIGCGYGDFVHDLTHFNIGKIIGYDISRAAITKGKERFGSDIDLRVGTFSDINLSDQSCDVILLLGVLWFLLDDLDNVFRKVNNMLSDSGEFFLTLHVPPNPIGKEIISSYHDLTNLVSKFFLIVDAFHWYQSQTIVNNEFSLGFSNILLRCKKK